MPESDRRAWERGEFGLIDRIRAAFPRIDLTDDCAAMRPPRDERLLLTTDAAVAGVHFPNRPEFMVDAGFRAFAGAASDIDASAGNPHGALLALVIPADLTTGEFDDFIRGISEYSALSGIPIIGGNIARGREFAATITVVGSTAKLVTRSGAQPDDLLLVSGALGGSEAGRLIAMGEIKSETISKKVREELEARFRRPSPPLGLGAKLARIGATAMIDISDGLLADATHIAESSGIEIAIELDRIPIFRGVAEVAAIRGIAPDLLAARSGEEYELLFTIPKNALDAAKSLSKTIAVIGHIKQGGGITPTRSGVPIATNEIGWRHF